MKTFKQVSKRTRCRQSRRGNPGESLEWGNIPEEGKGSYLRPSLRNQAPPRKTKNAKTKKKKQCGTRAKGSKKKEGHRCRTEEVEKDNGRIVDFLRGKDARDPKEDATRFKKTKRAQWEDNRVKGERVSKLGGGRAGNLNSILGQRKKKKRKKATQNESRDAAAAPWKKRKVGVSSRLHGIISINEKKQRRRIEKVQSTSRHRPESGRDLGSKVKTGLTHGYTRSSRRTRKS